MWITKTGCAAMFLGKEGTAETRGELRGKKCVGISKIYNDESFRLQRTVGVGSQQSRHVTPFWALTRLRSRPCISLP